MAEPYFIGGALDVAQITTIAVSGAWATGDTATLTINGKDIILTVGTDTSTAQIATALKEMFNGNTQTGTGDHDFSETGNNVQEFSEITATVDSSTLTLTGDTKGKPFEITVSESTAGTGALGSPTEATAATGAKWWDNADNWSTGSVPVSTDDVVLDSRAANDILYGLDQSAVTLASLTITNGFTFKVGLPEINADSNQSTYPEYRETYLAISATTLTIHGSGAGTSRIKVNLGTAASTMNISSNGNASGVPAVLIQGTNTANIARITKGNVGFAFYDGESAHLATLDVGFQENQAGDSNVVCGDGVDLTDATVTQSGGVLTIETATSSGTITQSGGTLHVNDGAHAQIDVAGTLYYSGAGDLTALNVSGGTADFRRGTAAVTVTNCELGRSSTLLDPGKRVTFTNGIDLSRCGIDDLQKLDLGKHITLTPSAI